MYGSVLQPIIDHSKTYVLTFEKKSIFENSSSAPQVVLSLKMILLLCKMDGSFFVYCNLVLKQKAKEEGCGCSENPSYS